MRTQASTVRTFLEGVLGLGVVHDGEEHVQISLPADGTQEAISL